MPVTAQAQSGPLIAQPLPVLGDPASQFLSQAAEAQLGRHIMRSLRRDPDYLDDPLLLEYVQSIWQRLLAASRAQGLMEVGSGPHQYAWEPFLVRDRSVNAFALPGGFVGVHLGLMALTQTPDELASVLSHELSHVTQRHIARSIDSAQQQSMLGVAAMIVGAMVAARSSDPAGGAAQALIVGGQAGSVQAGLNFSRDMEREADRLGLGVLAGAGFAPQGMAQMFERLDKASRLNDAGGFAYLRTHPLNAARIGEVRSRLGTGSAQWSQPAVPAEHVVAQARARVLMDTRTPALQRWLAFSSAETAQSLGPAYSAALAATLLQEWSIADVALRKAQAIVEREGQRDPKAQRWVALLRAQSMLARGDAMAAWEAMKAHTHEVSRPALILASQVVVALLAPPSGLAAQQMGQELGGRLAQEMQSWLAGAAGDAGMWQALSQVQGALKQGLRSIRSEAEAHFAAGDWLGAADRLRSAQRGLATQPADFIELSVMDARLRSIEKLLKDQALETRGP